MHYPKNDHPGPGDLEDSPIVPVQEMAIGGPEEFVFRNERTALGKSLQRSDLLLDATDKRGCRVGIVMWNVLPNLSDIRLCDGSNLNPVYCGHA